MRCRPGETRETRETVGVVVSSFQRLNEVQFVIKRLLVVVPTQIIRLLRQGRGS